MKGKLTFLGTGGSLGVPVVGCACCVCSSSDPLNHRMRSSALIQAGGRQFLIDSGPDFRSQALKFGISRLDGILLTHAHHDHVGGIDDLRPIYYKRESPLPILLSEETAKELCRRFHYIFADGKDFLGLRLDLLSGSEGTFLFENFPVQFVSYSQGGMKVNGYRFGSLAYLSDIRQFSPSIFEHLKGVRDLIVSALRFTPSPLHFSVDEAIDFARQADAAQVWLTHVSHDLEHHQTNAYLPSHVRLAYDGLEIDFDDR